MIKESEYIVNRETLWLASEFEGLCSTAMEGDKTYFIPQPPEKVIDYSLEYYGSSMKGSQEASKSILGNKSILPILINAQLDIYLFPSALPKRTNCIWFSHSHIMRYQAHGKKQTKVYMSYDKSTDEMDMVSWKEQRSLFIFERTS